MGNKFSELSNEILDNSNLYGLEDYTRNTKNYIRSKGVLENVNKIFKSSESSQFYIESGMNLLDRIDLDEFALENYLDSCERFYTLASKLNKTKKSSSYKSLSITEKNAIDNLFTKSVEVFDRKFGMEAKPVATKNGTAYQQKGRTNVFTMIKNIIKKFILAISNFFRGIFQKIRSFFRKFNHSTMQKYFAIAEKNVEKLNGTKKASWIEAPWINTSIVTILKKIPETSNKIKQKFDSAMGNLSKFASKSHNMFGDMAFKGHLKIQTTLLNGAIKDLSSVGISSKGGNYNINSADGIRKIVYGDKNKPKLVKKTTKEFLSNVKMSGLHKINMDQLVNNVSKAMTELNAKMTQCSNLINTIEKQFSGSNKPVKPGVLKTIQQSFKKTMDIGKVCISFCNNMAISIYKVYTQLVKIIVKIAKGTNSTIKTEEKNAKKAAKGGSTKSTTTKSTTKKKKK